MPASTAPCTGGITAAPTRIVNATAEPTPSAGAATAPPPAEGISRAIEALLGEPGQGIPVEPRGPVAEGRQGQVVAVVEHLVPARRLAAQGPRIPGAPDLGSGGLGRAMVAYAVAGDGQLHVVGLQSGKDLQKPAPFLPANSQWSNPVAVGTMMYAATSGTAPVRPTAFTPSISMRRDKPVVSYRTNGGSVVGSVAFSSDGNTLIAAIGPGSVTADGKANAIVALDPRTLKLKDWFTQPTAEFVTGPTVFRHGAKDVVAAATKDGRVILLDVASLGGANHTTPLMASQSLVASGGSIAAEALATWARPTAATPTALAPSERWILVPVSGRPSDARATNGAIRTGAVVALRVAEAKGVFSLEPEWTSNDLTTPATPIIVNGVVFALSTGRAASAAGNGIAGGALCLRWSYRARRFGTAASRWRPLRHRAATGARLSQVYVGTDDGTVYAFGFLDERR